MSSGAVDPESVAERAEAVGITHKQIVEWPLERLLEELELRERLQSVRMPRRGEEATGFHVEPAGRPPTTLERARELAGWGPRQESRSDEELRGAPRWVASEVAGSPQAVLAMEGVGLSVDGEVAPAREWARRLGVGLDELRGLSVDELATRWRAQVERGAMAEGERRRLHRRLEREFTYHPPQGDQVDRYQRLRSQARVLGEEIVDRCPVGREQSLALTKLREVVMWANAAIAVGEAGEGGS